MTPTEAETAVARHLGLAQLPPGVLGFKVDLDNDLVMELHLNEARDYLLLRTSLGAYPEQGAHGAHAGLLMVNLAAARTGRPVLAAGPHLPELKGQKVLWLPSLGVEQLGQVIDTFSAACKEMRMQMRDAAKA